MPFTKAEKREWHESRDKGHDLPQYTPAKDAICSHCSAPFVGSQGLVTADFNLCPACDNRS